MAAHTHTYAPRVVSTAGTLDFRSNNLLPLDQSDVQFSNRVRISTVPLQNGGALYDIRRAPCVMSFSGQMHVSQVTGAKEDILTLASLLHTHLCGGTGTPAKFTFYRHYDSTNGNYRWWRNCACNDLQIHWTSRTLSWVPYSFSFTSADGVEYEQIGTTTHDPDVPAITEYASGPQLVKLADDAGESSFVIKNASGNTVFRVDSLGNVYYTGLFESVVQIT